MKFDEWWNEKALRYFAIIRENGSMSAERVVDLEQSCKRLACIAWRAAQPKWQPIEKAPKNEMILLLQGDGCMVSGCWEEGLDREGYSAWVDYDGNELEPVTHWMPLPEVDL